MKRSVVFLLLLFVISAVAQEPAAGPGTPGSSMSPAPAAQPATPASAPAQSEAAPVTEQITTEIKRQNTDGPDPLLDPPALPNEKLSLIGGTVRKMDRLRNRMQVDVFGGKKMEVFFDNRTRILRNGAKVQPAAIKQGDRIYLDTMLHERRIFAKNIVVQNEITPAEAQGQISGFNAKEGKFTLRDRLSESDISFRLAPDTVIKKPDGSGSVADIRPGALVALRFAPDKRDRGLAREINILALPGSTFTFHGRITHLDVKSGVLAIENQVDQKTYEIVFDPATMRVTEDWQIGAEATIVASFDGPQYTARSINLVRAPQGQ